MVGLRDKNNSLSIDVVVLVTLQYGIECGKLVCIIYHKYSKCVEKVTVDYFQKNFCIDASIDVDMEEVFSAYNAFVSEGGQFTTLS